MLFNFSIWIVGKPPRPINRHLRVWMGVELSLFICINGPSIHIIVDMCERQNVSFSLYLAQKGRGNQGFVGSVPIWNPVGILISHMEVGISEVGIILRVSYIGAPLLEPAAPCSTLTGI